MTVYLPQQGIPQCACTFVHIIYFGSRIIQSYYTFWVYVASGNHMTGDMSVPRMVSLAARGIHTSCMKLNFLCSLLATLCTCITSAPPTPTEVTTWFVSASSVRVTWQWTSSGPAPDCFNTTTVTYHPEDGSESSLQLSDPGANETILTDLQNNKCYTITVVAIAGEHKSEGVARTVLPPQQGILNSWTFIQYSS